jgi:NitT/TauT family transport system substrate-binding protein
MHMSKISAACLCATLAAFGALASPARAADEAHTLSVQLEWLPTGYQAPFFLALEKGWYKQHGLDVTLSQGTGSVTTVQVVGTGSEFDAGEAALSNMAFARNKGLPVISFASFFRTGDLALLVPVDSSLKVPADLKGKKLVYTAGSLESPFIAPFLAKGGLIQGDIQLLNVDANSKYSTFMTGNVDGVFSSTAGTAAVVAKRRVSRSILFSDFGLNLPGFGLFATQASLKKKGDALRIFASITSGAWAYILKGHEDEGVQAILKTRENDRLDATIIAGQLHDSLPFLYSPATKNLPIGVQADADWTEAIAVMEQAKTIEPGSKPSDYYTNDYLDLNLIKEIGG